MMTELCYATHNVTAKYELNILQRKLYMFRKLHSRNPVYVMYIKITKQNSDVPVFWVEIVLTILNYRYRFTNLAVFQRGCSTHQILSLKVACFLFKTSEMKCVI